MNLPDLDTQTYRRARVEQTVPAQGWHSELGEKHRRRGGAGYWQESLRSALDIRLGGLSTWERVPLDTVVHEVVELDGYRREAITFATRPGLRAFGYYLVPNNISGREPAVLCLPGHGRGVDSIVGIAEDGTQRKLGEVGEYQADFALRCVAEGYPAFALEQISFGHRRDDEARRQGPGASSCTRDSMAALMVGESVIGWRVWDAMRALDFLLTRPEVAPDRLATMGISGGGLTSLFTAALDTRVACAVVSGYLCTFADSILAVNHCVDNYAPGLLSLCEMPDIAGLIAPRLLFAESGDVDPIFPKHGFEKAVAQTAEIYAAFNAETSFAYELFSGDHRFYGEGAFAFLRERI
ncbi:MAG: alpha/beta hydrolase family protein [Armatimonadaceae bacterium]